MSVRIRLRRVGRKKQPYFRIIVADSATPRDGQYIESIGFYNPRTRPAYLMLDLERVDDWLSKGAELTETARTLVNKARKGGDAKVQYVKPGEEPKSRKTAAKPMKKQATCGCRG
ncbi:MAG: 30S ribosomal protein S16 [Gemmatimonadota bacterium]